MSFRCSVYCSGPIPTSAIWSLSERLHQADESFWGDFSSFSILIKPWDLVFWAKALKAPTVWMSWKAALRSDSFWAQIRCRCRLVGTNS